MKYFPTTATKEQSKDTGMAIILICLIVGYFTHNYFFIAISIVVVIIDMVIPSVFKPVAIIWFGISSFLGTIMSKLLLVLLFFLLVLPVGLIRKALGYDTMKLKEWKIGTSSVFIVREHIFQFEDINKPY